MKYLNLISIGIIPITTDILRFLMIFPCINSEVELSLYDGTYLYLIMTTDRDRDNLFFTVPGKYEGKFPFSTNP